VLAIEPLAAVARRGGLGRLARQFSVSARVREHAIGTMRAVEPRSWTPGWWSERVVTLQMGLGRDSVAMLLLLVEGHLVAEGVPIVPDDVDAVVFVDTGAEWKHTLAVSPRVRALCDRHRLRYLVLEKPGACGETGYAGYLAGLPPLKAPGRREALAARPWRAEGATPDTIEGKARSGWYHLQPPILEEYRSRETIVTRQTPDCTSKNKVEPARKLLDDLSLEAFGIGTEAWGRDVKAGRRPPHLSLLGIAANEAGRVQTAHVSMGGPGRWYVAEAYPLVEIGVTKADEAPILERHGFSDMLKSGCVLCPYQPVGWYWALRETDPAKWADVVEYEAAALAKNARMFIAGDTPIAEAVERWRAKHPDATVEGVLAKSYERDRACQTVCKTEPAPNPAACPDCVRLARLWTAMARAA
jgi:hypothetical protein